MKKQYVYIGQYYHIRNKELPVDYKFGVTTNLNQRERELSRTNSPIKYMIINAWEIPSNIIREKVENIIELIFNDSKYPGCEWYDIDGETFKIKIKKLFEILTDMVEDNNFAFTEVDLSNKFKPTSDEEYLLMKKERQIRGIEIAKSNGVYKGRKVGTKESIDDFLNKDKNKKAIELLKEGYKGVEISKMINIHINTITKLKKYI